MLQLLLARRTRAKFADCHIVQQAQGRRMMHVLEGLVLACLDQVQVVTSIFVHVPRWYGTLSSLGPLSFQLVQDSCRCTRRIMRMLAHVQSQQCWASCEDVRCCP